VDIILLLRDNGSYCVTKDWKLRKKREDYENFEKRSGEVVFTQVRLNVFWFRDYSEIEKTERDGLLVVFCAAIGNSYFFAIENRRDCLLLRDVGQQIRGNLAGR